MKPTPKSFASRLANRRRLLWYGIHDYRVLVHNRPNQSMKPTQPLALRLWRNRSFFFDWLGGLINLKELEISCLENLEDLPVEIGQLKKLEKIIIDNGNGCRMNVSIPASIAELTNLKVLRLFGALDPEESESSDPAPTFKSKPLPTTIAKL